MNRTRSSRRAASTSASKTARLLAQLPVIQEPILAQFAQAVHPAIITGYPMGLRVLRGFFIGVRMSLDGSRRSGDSITLPEDCRRKFRVDRAAFMDLRRRYEQGLTGDAVVPEAMCYWDALAREALLAILGSTTVSDQVVYQRLMAMSVLLVDPALDYILVEEAGGDVGIRPEAVPYLERQFSLLRQRRPDSLCDPRSFMKQYPTADAFAKAAALRTASRRSTLTSSPTRPHRQIPASPAAAATPAE